MTTAIRVLVDHETWFYSGFGAWKRSMEGCETQNDAVFFESRFAPRIKDLVRIVTERVCAPSAKHHFTFYADYKTSPLLESHASRIKRDLAERGNRAVFKNCPRRRKESSTSLAILDDAYALLLETCVKKDSSDAKRAERPETEMVLFTGASIFGAFLTKAKEHGISTGIILPFDFADISPMPPFCRAAFSSAGWLATYPSPSPPKSVSTESPQQPQPGERDLTRKLQVLGNSLFAKGKVITFRSLLCRAMETPDLNKFGKQKLLFALHNLIDSGTFVQVRRFTGNGDARRVLVPSDTATMEQKVCRIAD
jgi:hypothetical protein